MKSRLDEAALIRRYFARPATRRGDVVLGIGDDAAVTRLAGRYELVTAADAIFEGVHFPAGTPAHALGHRCLAVNLSDLAAMGAEPLWAVLVLSMPAADPGWLRQFSRGLFSLARAFGVGLIGGDTVRGPLGMSVTVLGRARPGRWITRSGARAGDGIYVTGHPGDAVAGRLGRRSLRRQFLYPVPRVREGISLVGVASAMIDISDGLHDDARKLLRSSGVGAVLDAGSLPLSRELVRFAGPAGARDMALTGGDDYELLFTVPTRRERALGRIVKNWDCPVTRLGVVTSGRGAHWRLEGRRHVFADRTFRHFR